MHTHTHTHTQAHTQVMEQLLRFSIQLVLDRESSQHERLGALYLAYTLHSSQPCQQPQAVVGDYYTTTNPCISVAQFSWALLWL